MNKLQQTIDELSEQRDAEMLGEIKRNPEPIIRRIMAMYYDVPRNVLNELERQISEDAGSQTVR